jgi:hypothetical protein
MEGIIDHTYAYSGAMTFNIKTFSIAIRRIMGLFATLSINDTRHK